MNKSDQVQSGRAIAHFDLDAFFCSVEVLQDPSLRDKPLVVGGRIDQRGVVAAASYPARKFGIHSAMSMYQAQKRCPDLVIRAPRFKAYKTYSRIVMGIMRSVSPMIQQVSVDEAYLDLSESVEIWSEAESLVKDLQNKIVRDIGLSVSAGLASNKMIAKIASDFEKPAGLTIVKPGNEKTFLAPLTVDKIPGIGPKTARKLAGLNIRIVKDLSDKSEVELAEKFGKWGREMYRWSRGIDNRPVREEHDVKSVSTERTFSKDISDRVELQEIIVRLSEQVARQISKENRLGRTIQIKVRYADFETYTRQISLSNYTDNCDVIIKAATGLFDKSWIPGSAIRLLGVGISNFASPEMQMTLDI